MNIVMICKKYIIYVIVVLCATSFYTHQFFPESSERFTVAKNDHKKAKKERSRIILKIIDKSKDTALYNEFQLQNKITNSLWDNYLNIKKEEKLFGFKSARYFVERFGLMLCIFIYALYNLVTSFLKEPTNAGVKIIHTFIISVCFNYFYWIFQSFQDLSKTTYVFMTLFSAILVSLGVYFITKYKKTTIQKLEVNNKEAQNTIELLEKEVLIKQEEQRAEERQRISEELHDGVLGKLFGTRMGLGFLDLSKSESKEKYQSFLDELQEIEKEIREVSHKLNTNLNGLDIGFLQIVKQLFIDRSKLHGFSYSIHSDKSIDWNIVNEIDKVNLYRIIQESLQNTIKHARAKNVNLFLNRENKGVLIKIEDDGYGFDTSKSKKGIGLKNIQSRVKRLNGNFKISSELNKGTVLNIQIPIREKLTKVG
ncbi:sensor histidine kinase [Tenacibaculum litopenaei]|uniref:sensor histidine kinase n=1 Tax=Tenacibaculum litopenaei TaxID=396016 RepID=UPI0038B6876C